jgi:subfamily B ATP-binding cassette protein MsbA
MLDENQRRAIWDVVTYDPKLSSIIAILSLLTAALEGVGIGFILPIITLARDGEAAPRESSGIFKIFVDAYEALGVSFSLEYIILGTLFVMTLRYAASFGVDWFREILRTEYEKYLKSESFKKTLDAEAAYFDREGSDEILNAIITQTMHASRTVFRGVQIVEEALIILVYLLITIYLSPLLTLATAILLGSIMFFAREVLESGYGVGDRIAETNEAVQNAVQSGTQGIRDVKLFGIADELFSNFRDAIERNATARIRLKRNQVGLNNFYQLISAATVFALVYVAIRFTSLSIGELGVFLFAMFRLAPRVSSLNDLVYAFEGDLPHLVRTRSFVRELENRAGDGNRWRAVPTSIENVRFENVWFSYEGVEPVIENLSFQVKRNEFVAFVGQSGAGKSTITSLVARFYTPDRGRILANGIPIDKIDINDWRERISVVRQDPYLFNDSLWYNVTIADRDASREEVERVCEIAQVTEFLPELPEGYDTLLGDDGVRLSGGQKQRVALARALLKKADVLVLDEATSDLDSGIERDVQSAIESMDRDYALIAIAHRLSTVRNADRIYTIEGGKMTDVGSHEELISSDGLYAQLYSTQRQGE